MPEQETVYNPQEVTALRRREIAQSLRIISSLLSPGEILGLLPQERIPTVLGERLRDIELQLSTLAAKLDKSIPCYEQINLDALGATPENPLLFITVQNNIQTAAPVSVVHNSLPQLNAVDFAVDAVDKKKINWLNLSENSPLDGGILEITYWKL